MKKEIKLIKFPRLARQQNRSCKLTDDQIEEIREMRKSGASYGEIGKNYGITASAVSYWCLTDEQRKIKIKMAAEHRKLTGYIPPKKFDHKKYRLRKMEIQPAYKEYENQFTSTVKRKIRPTFADTHKKANKNYYQTHLKERTEASKKYQLANLDKFREYNKKHRELYPEKVREQKRKSYHKNKITS